MKNILLLSQKGGTGKTTLADNIAYVLEDEGQPVAFYDTDPQGGALHATNEPEGAAIAVIDTPGALTENTRSMIEDADIVVIPTQASALDMNPLQRVRVLVERMAPNVPVLVVINGFNRWNNAKDFRDWLESELRPIERIAVLSQSENIRKAAAEGQSVLTYAPKSRSGVELAEIVALIKEALKIEG